VSAVAQETEGGLRIPAKDIADPQSVSRNLLDKGDEHQGIRIDSAGVRKRMVRQIVAQIKTREGQLGANHVDAVLELARGGQSGKELQLPGGVEVRKDRESLVFRATKNAETAGARNTPRKFSYNVDLTRGTQDVQVPELGCVFRLSVIDWPSPRAETNKGEMVLDREQLRSPLVLRNWRPGDRFQASGHQNAHKLKRLLNEKHISRWERDGWPVLTSGGILVWARGFPVAADFAANEGTRTGILIAEEQM
jgi:tRNA(Ile)-lysidine synthase